MSQNLKMRQKTLKDMVFSNLKPGNEHGHIDPLPSINSNTLMQYSKVPPKSPASPTGSDPNGENQEAIVVFSKGVARRRQLSRNKHTSSSVIGPDGQEELNTDSASREEEG